MDSKDIRQKITLTKFEGCTTECPVVLLIIHNFDDNCFLGLLFPNCSDFGFLATDFRQDCNKKLLVISEAGRLPVKILMASTTVVRSFQFTQNYTFID